MRVDKARMRNAKRRIITRGERRLFVAFGEDGNFRDAVVAHLREDNDCLRAALIKIAEINSRRVESPNRQKIAKVIGFAIPRLAPP